MNGRKRSVWVNICSPSFSNIIMSSLSFVGPFSCLLLLLGLSVAWSVMDICSRCDLDNHRKNYAVLLQCTIFIYVMCLWKSLWHGEWDWKLPEMAAISGKLSEAKGPAAKTRQRLSGSVGWWRRLWWWRRVPHQPKEAMAAERRLVWESRGTGGRGFPQYSVGTWKESSCATLRMHGWGPSPLPSRFSFLFALVYIFFLLAFRRISSVRGLPAGVFASSIYFPIGPRLRRDWQFNSE